MGVFRWLVMHKSPHCTAFETLLGNRSDRGHKSFIVPFICCSLEEFPFQHVVWKEVSSELRIRLGGS